MIYKKYFWHKQFNRFTASLMKCSNRQVREFDISPSPNSLSVYIL